MKKELCDTINKILKNEKIIKLLSKENKDNRGFLLGKIEYFDDINVLIMYGITLDKEDKTKAKIFSYKLFPRFSGEVYNFKLEDSLPQIPQEFRDGGYPSKYEINQSIEKILNNPKERLIDYGPFSKNN